jgi:hypothetical protein
MFGHLSRGARRHGNLAKAGGLTGNEQKEKWERRMRLVHTTWMMTVLLLGLVAVSTPSLSATAMKFWNLTANTITELSLAPPGSNKWGPNQCLNDSDKSVDADERLVLKDVEPGTYDVRLKDKTGRICVVKNVEVKSGSAYAFSIEEGDLKGCKK